jgi:hypothetical protein
MGDAGRFRPQGADGAERSAPLCAVFRRRDRSALKVDAMAQEPDSSGFQAASADLDFLW